MQGTGWGGQVGDGGGEGHWNEPAGKGQGGVWGQGPGRPGRAGADAGLRAAALAHGPPRPWKSLALGAGPGSAHSLAPSGEHFEAKVFAKLFQEDKREHGVRHEADACRHEALGGERGSRESEDPRGTPSPAAPALPQPCRPSPAASALPNLVKGQRPELCCLYSAVKHTLQKTQNKAKQ